MFNPAAIVSNPPRESERLKILFHKKMDLQEVRRIAV